MHQIKPPRFLESLFSTIAGPENGDAIVGDVAEQYVERCRYNDGLTNRASIWYLAQVVRSAPCLIRLRLQSASKADYSSALWLFVISAVFLLSYNHLLNLVSWPIASFLRSVTQLGVIFTCFSVYVALYAIGTLAALIAITFVDRLLINSDQSTKLKHLLLAVYATVPGLGYIIQPKPFDDSLSFRLAQIFAVWLTLILYLINRRPRPDNVTTPV